MMDPKLTATTNMKTFKLDCYDSPSFIRTFLLHPCLLGFYRMRNPGMSESIRQTNKDDDFTDFSIHGGIRREPASPITRKT